MHKRTFQSLKHTFMRVSSLPQSCFDKKTKYLMKFFFQIHNMVGEDMIHALTCVSGPETHVYACLRSSPAFFDNKTNLKSFWFYYQNKLGEDLRHA